MSTTKDADRGRTTPSKRWSTSSSVAPSSPVQQAWSSVKGSYKSRPSLPDLRWPWSFSRRLYNDGCTTPAQDRRSADTDNSSFCNSLIGVMQRNAKFEYLGFKVRQEEKDVENKSFSSKAVSAKHSKRFSWTR